MATPGKPEYGVTHPLSTALPTDAENKASAALIEELKRENNYESSAETAKRYATYT
jgi:poly(A) polymerase